MIDTCPHCHEPLNLSNPQKAKIQTALDNLPPGNLLKLGCPHCHKPFELKADGSLQLMASPGEVPLKGARRVDVKPPPSPDLSWLASGKIKEEGVIEDTPMVLVRMDKGPAMATVIQVYEDEGYLPVFSDSSDDAIEKMQFTPFSAVVLHSSSAGDSLDRDSLHNFLRKMPMNRRRNIHYTLIGPEFQTLYDLQALSNSVNLVVNDKEIKHFRLVLKKSLHESQKLFGPLAEALMREGRISGSIWLDIKIKAEQQMKSAVLKDLLEARS